MLLILKSDLQGYSNLQVRKGAITANDRALWYSVNIRRIGSHDPGTVKEIVLVFSQARYQINRLLRRAIYPSSLLYTP